jgi:HSP20 family protein
MIGNDGSSGFARIVNGLAELMKVLTEADKSGALPRRGRREKDGFVVEYSLNRRVLDASVAETREAEASEAEASGPEPPPRGHKWKPSQLQLAEPVTDLFDEPGEVVVLYELPGIERKNIRFHRDGDILLLEARSEHRLYRKELLIEAALAEAPPGSRLRNGVFELRLRKRG